MWLFRVLQRGHGRLITAAFGLAISIATALIMAPWDQPELDGGASITTIRVLDFEPIAARSDRPAEAFTLEAAPQEPESPIAGETPESEAPPTPVQAAPLEEPPVPSPVASPAFEQLPVVDPMTNMEVRPVAFSELPAAEPAPAPAGEADVAVYVPGSIGKAKRQWAGGEDGAMPERGRRGLIIGVGGGHCPVPGRVIPPLKGSVLKLF